MKLLMIFALIVILGWAPAPVVAVLSWVVIGYLLFCAWPTICRHWQAFPRLRDVRRRRQAPGRYSADRQDAL